MMKIENDVGSGCFTRIYDENGVDLTKHLWIERVTMDMGDKDDVVRATVTIGVLKTSVNATLVKWITRHPLTEKSESVASITFRDGSCVCFSEGGRATVYGAHNEDTGIAKVVPYGTGRVFKFRAPADADATADHELKTAALKDAS